MFTGGAAALSPARTKRIAATLFFGIAQLAQGHGHGGPDDEEGNAAGPGQGAWDEDDDHQDEEGQGALAGEGPDRGPDDIIDASGFVDDGHEEGGREENEDDVEIGEGPFDEVTPKLTGRRRREKGARDPPGHGRCEHAQLDGQALRFGQGVGADHDGQDDQDVRGHRMSSASYRIGGARSTTQGQGGMDISIGLV